MQSGASLIVGAHPHIILPSETILGVPVYYSLGNFIFDQYWNYSVTHGLVLEVAIHNGQLSLNELRTELEKDGRTCVIPLSLIDKKPIDSR